MSTASPGPDGRHLAFTKLAAPLLVDSDLWLLAIETAELRNLTDDGVGGGFTGSLQ